MVDGFYRVLKLEAQEEGAWAEVELNPGHAVYEGHFPGMPVVPGVCTLMMVKECAEKWKGVRYRYQYLNTCKFLSAVRPDEDRVLGLRLEMQETDGECCCLQARVYAGDRMVLKLKANLAVG